ncbi:MAG: T9SS type A sorting domain-containing protein [bacterium]
MPAVLGKVERNGDEKGPDPYPSDWAWQQRTFPHGTADKTAHIQALQQAQSMRRLAKSSHLNTVWNFAGPENIGGRISDIEFNPQDASVVYAGAATGGVFKSTDGGVTWSPVFDDQAVLPIGDLAVDPNDPDIVYAGTGEANGGHNNFPGGGVFKSTDAGASWQYIGLAATTSIGRIVIDPSNSNRVFVAAVGSYFGKDHDRGVYRSDDAGQGWQQVLFVNDSTGAIDLVIDPQSPNKLFAATWERVRPPEYNTRLTGPSSGIYRSLDGGDFWQRLGTAQGLPGTRSNVGRIGLAICASQPLHLYALHTNTSGGGYTYDSLYRSRDGGDTWQRTDVNNRLRSGFSNFSWYFGNVRVHPADPERAYVLDLNLMTSDDGGANWQFASTSHVDHHALAFDPSDPQRLITGNDGGMDISTDGGASWEEIAGLPVTQFYHITMDVNNPERLYGGTQDNGTMRTLTGNLDDWEYIFGGDGFYVIVDPTDPNVIYAESQFGVLDKSTDGGYSFGGARNGINTNEPRNWSTPVVMDPNDSQVLYYGTNRVYRTTNGAGNWEPISDTLTLQNPGSRLGTVTSIAVARSNPEVVYAGTDDSQVWVTNDGGKSWTEVSQTLPYRWVTRVAVDPTNESVAYVTFSGLKWNSPQPHVFRTADMGATWQDISSNLPDAPVNTIVVDPLYPHFLYVGTDVSAYYSANTGQSWQPLGAGLPMVSVYDLFVHPTERILAAGTHGRSMYTFDLSTLTGVEERGEGHLIAGTLTLEQNYPNPFNPATAIIFSLPVAAEVLVQIFNTRGQLVRMLLREGRESGSHVVHWNGRDEQDREVANGMYFYQLRAGSQVLQKKLILLR